MKRLRIFVPLTKIDLARREVWGLMAEEAPDKSGEIFDYSSSKPYVEKWSEQFSKATRGRSLGNVRAMHRNIAAGKLIAIEFDDANKKISIGAKIVDDEEWEKVADGIYTGFSIGGKYVKTWQENEFTRYTANPNEVSLVDNPCMYGALFSAVKADGTTEMRKFTGSRARVEGNQVALNSRNDKSLRKGQYAMKHKEHLDGLKQAHDDMQVAHDLCKAAHDKMGEHLEKLLGGVSDEVSGGEEEQGELKEEGEAEEKAARSFELARRGVEPQIARLESKVLSQQRDLADLTKTVENLTTALEKLLAQPERPKAAARIVGTVVAKQQDTGHARDSETRDPLRLIKKAYAHPEIVPSSTPVF